MCHERWITHSDAAVERSWLRPLSQRDRLEAPRDDERRETEAEAPTPVPGRLEPVGSER